MAAEDIGQWGPEPFWRPGGRPIRAAVIRIYEDDGSTLATLYADQDGTALANPLPVGVATGDAGLDTEGNGLFFAAPGAYIQAVTVNGVEVYRSPITVDSDVIGSGGAAGGVLSGTYPNPGFAVDMATQAELDAEAALARNADNLTSGTVADARIAASIARDSEVSSAVSTHAAAVDPHTGYRLESVAITAADVAADVATQAELDAEAAARAAADALLIPLTQRAAADGVATLDSGGKIPSAQLPPLAIGETFNVASQAAMLALTAQRGDIAIRTDLNPDGVFILTTDDPTTLANWVQITAPGAVLSVDGRTGTVSLSDLYDALGAAAAAQAVAVQRANHTGTQAASTISDFAEAVQDVAGAMATDGTTVNFTYDDTAGTLTAEVQGLTSASLSDFAEAVRDRVGATLVAGAGISVTVDDPGDTVTVASTITQYTDEAVRDAVGAALVAGNNIDITVNDGADTITIDVEALTSADVGDFAEAVDDRVNALLVAGANVTLTYDDGANTLTVAATGGGGGVSDGDKGDITVSGGGSAWTVDNNAITLAKLADIATARILGRTTAGSGDPEELTAAQVRTLLGISAFIETLLDDANAATALATLGAIPLSVVDAADDLIVGSAADTVTRLAVDASRIVGKKATGGLAALTAAETALLSGGLLAAVSYNPATSVSVATTSTTFADIDATNLVLPFTVPPSGKVLVRMSAAVVTADLVAMNWNLRDAGGDIAGTRAVVIRPAGGQRIRANTAIVVTGLTPGEAKSWKWGQARTTSTGTCETLYGQTDISALGTPGAAVMEVYAIP